MPNEDYQNSTVKEIIQDWTGSGTGDSDQGEQQ